MLGVSSDASGKEIKRAFRKLALEYHPDRNKNKDAESKFIRIAAGMFLHVACVMGTLCHECHEPMTIYISRS